MLAEGQVHGGVAQGLGQAMLERVVYDEDGQLLTASFMDYALPRASGVPMIGFTSEPVPSTQNPMGMKGCGEAGTVGALAAVANAVQDAVWDRGVRQVDMPFTSAEDLGSAKGCLLTQLSKKVLGWLGRPLRSEHSGETKLRGPQAHVIILDGTMVDPGGRP